MSHRGMLFKQNPLLWGRITFTYVGFPVHYINVFSLKLMCVEFHCYCYYVCIHVPLVLTKTMCDHECRTHKHCENCVFYSNVLSSCFITTYIYIYIICLVGFLFLFTNNVYKCDICKKIFVIYQSFLIQSFKCAVSGLVKELMEVLTRLQNHSFVRVVFILTTVSKHKHIQNRK